MRIKHIHIHVILNHVAAQSPRKHLHLDVSIKDHGSLFSDFFRFGGFGVCLLCSLYRKGICSRACVGRLLILLQYELSGCICLCYSGTQNSIPPSCLILHNGRLLTAGRITPLTDGFDNCCTYFTPELKSTKARRPRRWAPASRAAWPVA